MKRVLTCSVLLLIIAAGTFVPWSVARAAKTSQIFPELAERKGSLGRTLILVDVALVDDIAGNVEKIKLARSSMLAHAAANELTTALRAAGIPVDTAVVATIGMGLNLVAPYQSDSILATGPEDTSQVIRAPFFVDSMLADPEAREAWRKFIESGWNYARAKGKPAGFLAEPVTLGSRLGYDTIALFYVSSWGVPTTKKLLWAVAGFTASSSTETRFVLADAKSGQVLWATRNVFGKSADPDAITKAVDDATKDLP